MLKVVEKRPVDEWSNHDLILQFERDICFGFRGFDHKYEHSEARKELLRRSLDVVPDIRAYLEKHDYANSDIRLAWKRLVDGIKHDNPGRKVPLTILIPTE